jgi:uncharacterized protein (TIGR03086 family)
MTDIAARYRKLAARFTELVDAVPADRWDRRSPCEEWTALDIVDHVVGTEAEHLDRMTFSVANSARSAVEGVDARSAWPIVRDRVQSALDEPRRAGEQYTGVFGRTTFAEAIDQFYSIDLVIHAWDLARSTGLEDFETIPPDEVEAVTAALVPIADMMRQPGVFGPEVALPKDADPQSKLLALVGRQP